MSWLQSAVAIVAALIAGINAPAEVTATPERGTQVQVTDTLPPPPLVKSPRERVNAIHYQLMNPDPAKEAWFIVTAEIGWSPQRQDLWWPFARRVMLGESGFCPNRLRGDVMPYPNSGCIQTRQGGHTDAGFGQVTPVHYGPGNWLCVDHGICDKWTIISEPWISMLSFVLLLDRSGSDPWCWSDAIIRYHNCNGLAPDR